MAEICTRYPVIVDSGYSATVLKQKEAAWKRIVDEFNNSNPGKAPYGQQSLKGLWRRLKDDAKAAVDNYNKLSQKTGGGPSKPAFKNKAVEITAALLGNTYDPLDDPLDDDVLPFQASPSDAAERRNERWEDVEEVEEIPIVETPQKKAKKRKQEDFDSRMLKMAEEQHEMRRKEHAAELEERAAKKEIHAAMLKEQDERSAILQLHREAAHIYLEYLKAKTRDTRANVD
ncbi:hypothetical protein R5R35_005624 [Gryllus longicercus]|uniref:Regulatory protein zeste n=1 Tax=Gryllus longicercus TaxID=2509291 RepID=A0AAN9Z7S2_9ORTH